MMMKLLIALQFEKDVDNYILHLDPGRAKTWKKYVRAKKKLMSKNQKLLL